MKKRDRAEVYDRLVILADRVMAKGSACANCPIGCITQEPSRMWCCGGCPHVGPTGCTVKALGCKLHLCDYESYNVTEHTLSRLDALARIARHYRLNFARASKEETLNTPEGVNNKWWWYNTKNGPHVHRESRNEKKAPATSCGFDVCSRCTCKSGT